MKKKSKVRKVIKPDLKEAVEKKLKFAQGEKQKGLSQMERLRVQLHRLDGAIIICKELLDIKDKNDNS